MNNKSQEPAEKDLPKTGHKEGTGKVSSNMADQGKLGEANADINSNRDLKPGTRR